MMTYDTWLASVKRRLKMRYELDWSGSVLLQPFDQWYEAGFSVDAAARRAWMETCGGELKASEVSA